MYERIYIYVYVCNLKYRFAYSEILVFMIIPSRTYKINEYTFYSWQSKQNRLKVAWQIVLLFISFLCNPLPAIYLKTGYSFHYFGKY